MVGDLPLVLLKNTYEGVTGLHHVACGAHRESVYSEGLRGSHKS